MAVNFALCRLYATVMRCKFLFRDEVYDEAAVASREPASTRRMVRGRKTDQTRSAAPMTWQDFGGWTRRAMLFAVEPLGSCGG